MKTLMRSVESRFYHSVTILTNNLHIKIVPKKSTKKSIKMPKNVDWSKLSSMNKKDLLLVHKNLLVLFWSL